MHGGRIINLARSTERDWGVSFFDLNRLRTNEGGSTTAHSFLPAQSQIVESVLLRERQLIVLCPHPVHIATRAFHLDTGFYPPDII